MKHRPMPGARVRLTGKFLRNTGQHVGSEGLSRWVVVPCSCGLCRGSDRFLAVNEPSSADPEWPRHFAVGNLEVSR